MDIQYLIEYTGGIFYITIARIIVSLIAFLVLSIELSVILAKDKCLNKKRKLELFGFIIVIVMLSVLISGTIGYYWGISVRI